MTLPQTPSLQRQRGGTQGGTTRRLLVNTCDCILRNKYFQLNIDIDPSPPCIVGRGGQEGRVMQS